MNKLHTEIDKLNKQIDILKQALIGAWLDYDAIPYQMATDEYDKMEKATVSTTVCVTNDYYKDEHQRVYKMSEKDVEALLDEDEPENKTEKCLTCGKDIEIDINHGFVLDGSEVSIVSGYGSIHDCKNFKGFICDKCIALANNQNLIDMTYNGLNLL